VDTLQLSGRLYDDCAVAEVCTWLITLQVGGDVVNDKSSAIITINAVGTIQMANKVATQMLG
jgi:hypothetical protein